MPSPYFAHPYNDYDLETVEAAYRKASDGRLKERLLMILLSLEGKQVDEIAEITHRCRDTVLKWLHRWNEKGFNGLKDRPYSGRLPILTELEVQKMLDWVCEEAYSGGRLTCKQIAFWVKETFDKVIDDESISRILHQNSFSWKKPGTRDYRADPEAQAKFMKELEERMGNESDTRFFFFDEVIFQLTTSTSHTWAPKDKRILLRGQLSRKKLIEMGAVEPETGESFHLFMPFTTKVTFRIFIEELSKVYPNDKIVLILPGVLPGIR